jgi:hypothetical protein
MLVKATPRLLFFISVFSATAEAGWFGPDNYDECILGSMKGVTSDRAATAIARSCRSKFPKNTVKLAKKDLSKAELKK